MLAPTIVLTLTFAVGCTTNEDSVTRPAAPADTPADADTPDSDTSNPSNSNSEMPKTVYLDVRTQSEWDDDHLDTAKHIPVAEVAEKIETEVTDKNTPIVVFCAKGGRAGRVKTQLEKMGYTDVTNGGGIDDVRDSQ
ncbi:MAG: rhodanese-like domain-containing protein [Planctomycetota bacterium]